MRLQSILLKLVLILLCLTTTHVSSSQNLGKKIDAYLSKLYSNKSPGISILVAKNGKAIYKKGFGMANLELDIEAKPKHVFEIGSITKQFTAVAILMLEEQGKLSVSDDITKYIPDYSTNGKVITIHQLLNHTSGIKSYTNMRNFRDYVRTDFTPKELIDEFKDEPMDFDPGTAYSYNNSGYILLGYIIEKVSGKSYGDFIQTTIFDKLGMNNSYYGGMKKLISNRASGYSKTNNSYANADYLSLTLPYAAGSLMSTTGDLLKWQNAIRSNKLISENSLNRAINGSKLSNGDAIDYGYGWMKGNVNGSNTYEHSGGIFGYSSNGIYLTDENIYVIGLSNCDCGDITDVTTNIAGIAIGKPYPDKEDAITLNDEQLKKWIGSYTFNNNVVRHITLENNQLYSQREDKAKLKIYPLSKTHFIFESGKTAYRFYTQGKDKMVKMTVNRKPQIGRSIGTNNEVASTDRNYVNLPKEILKEYIGKYELQPNSYMTVSVRNNRVFAMTSGEPEYELFASRRDKFFLNAVVASINFNRDINGNINSLILYQDGKEIIGEKIE